MLNLGRSIPVTVVIEHGEVMKTFIGNTSWRKIKPHAEKAKKNESDQTDRVEIGPLRIDWSDGVDIEFIR